MYGNHLCENGYEFIKPNTRIVDQIIDGLLYSLFMKHFLNEAVRQPLCILISKGHCEGEGVYQCLQRLSCQILEDTREVKMNCMLELYLLFITPV